MASKINRTENGKPKFREEKHKGHETVSDKVVSVQSTKKPSQRFQILSIERVSVLKLVEAVSQMFLKVQQQKLSGESKIIATGKAVPHRQEEQRYELAEMNVAEEFQTSINVLECKLIGAHVVGADDGGTGVGKFKFGQIHVRVTVIVDAVKRDATQNAGGLRDHPYRNVFVHVDFGNNCHRSPFPPKACLLE